MNTRHPSIGTKPTMLGRGDADTSLLSGEFCDPAVEHEYRLWRYDATLSQYKIVAWLLIVVAIPFLWTTYGLFGPTENYLLLASFRCVQLGISIWALWLAAHRARYKALDQSAFLSVLMVLTTNVMSMYLSPAVGMLMVVQSLMIVTTCYVVYPGRLVRLAPSLILFSCAFLATVALAPAILARDVPGIVVWTVIANAVGFLAARQLNRFRRSEYRSLIRAQQNVEELERATIAAERAQQEAETANRAKSAMLANTSHELRTPLNAIIGFSEMIEGQYLGPIENERYRQYAEHINGSGKHLLSLIDDLLDLSKIEAGQAEMHPEWVSAAAITTETLHMIESRAAARSVLVHHEIDPKLDCLLSDRRALRQILINLLTNAVKFSGPSSEISLQALLRADGSAELKIMDRGPGFEPDDIERLLQPFQQSEADPTRPREGWGLGLALVGAMADLNQITFSLGNREGGGAEAVLLFPQEKVKPVHHPLKIAASA
jgi:signal transduction histidine kinase